MKKITPEVKERFECFYLPMFACLLCGCFLGAALIMGAVPLALGSVILVAIASLGTIFLLAAHRDRDLRVLHRAKEKNIDKENQELRDSLQESYEMLTISRYAVFPEKLFASLKEKFPEMGGHWEWVSCYCALIAGKLGMEAEQSEVICRAVQLMDLGMLELDESIRLRQGAPIGDEIKMIKSHPLQSEKMLSRLDADWAILPLVRSHHEWWNGWGYPDGLYGEDIPLGARIIALADAFVAMLSPRAYREARDLEGVLNEIVLYKDKQFDPRVVDAFMELMVERFDLPISEWARQHTSEVEAGGEKVDVVSRWSAPERKGDWAMQDEEHELLEALWDINGVKRLTRVA
jgi:HD-GYP domain-containing protein (c-di-GMP phosphodiesterase class II)